MMKSLRMKMAVTSDKKRKDGGQKQLDALTIPSKTMPDDPNATQNNGPASVTCSTQQS